MNRCAVALLLVCFSCPTEAAADIPSAASAVLKKIDKACAAKNYRALRALMESSIGVEADGRLASSDEVITRWRAEPATLGKISRAIRSGCEVANGGDRVVVCPPEKNDAQGYLVAVRPDAAGSWHLYLATYTD